jgi:hypothetical protein
MRWKGSGRDHLTIAAVAAAAAAAAVDAADCETRAEVRLVRQVESTRRACERRRLPSHP